MGMQYDDLTLSEDRDFCREDDGSLVMRDEQARLLAYIGQKWDLPLEFRGHSINCYLTEVLRKIYYAPEQICALIREELMQQEKRRVKPTPQYLYNLCVAALRIERATAWPEKAPIVMPRRRCLDDDETV